MSPGQGLLLDLRVAKALPGLVIYWGYGFAFGPLLAVMVIVGALQLLTSWRPPGPTTGPLTDPSSTFRRLRN